MVNIDSTVLEAISFIYLYFFIIFAVIPYIFIVLWPALEKRVKNANKGQDPLIP